MHTITNSERAAAACPQRWLLKYGLGLRPVARTRVLDLGSLVHAGLEAYFGSALKPGEQGSIRVPLTDALRAIDLAHAAEVEKVKASSSSNGIIDAGAYIDPVALDGLAEDADNAKRLIGAYHTTWTNAPFALIHNEQTLTAPVRAPSGRGSSRTRFGGKIDKVVEYNCRAFIVEHKTTSLPLGEWVEKHRRSPQARSYAWLLAQRGIRVDGVIFDLIQSKAPKGWDSLPVLKDGSRLAKPQGLPWTTAEEFLLAVQTVGRKAINPTTPGGPDFVPGSLDDVEWYRPTYDALKARDDEGFWFRREVELFEPHELDRIDAELYRSATDIRRWRDLVEPVRRAVAVVAEAQPDSMPEAVEAALHDVGTQFPRESGICWQYNRLCPYASLCGSWSRYDVTGFVVTTATGGHSELDGDLDAKGQA